MLEASGELRALSVKGQESESGGFRHFGKLRNGFGESPVYQACTTPVSFLAFLAVW